jgi:hypothetical protein
LLEHIFELAERPSLEEARDSRTDESRRRNRRNLAGGTRRAMIVDEAVHTHRYWSEAANDYARAADRLDRL